MSIKVIQVKPNCLYPVITLESINPQTLSKVVESMKSGLKTVPIRVMCYKGYYFILEGNYEMLAANITQKRSVNIEILDRTKIRFWNKDEHVEEQLKSVGMRALYDFEKIGGFTYGEYPSLYKRGK